MNSVKKLVIVGCGAVAQQYFIPALKQVPGCAVEWFVDSNRMNAERAAVSYGGGKTATDYLGIIGKVDAAIVAVPNNMHSKVSVDFLSGGCPVLCEKPIADNSKNAEEMIKASRDSGACLAVNFPRRRFESYTIAKTLLEKSLIGKIHSIDYREGHSLRWPFYSSYLLRRDQSGGGVLVDWGAHKLDILSWLFGSNWQLVSYKDDGLGRIESNCEIDLVIGWRGVRIPCHVELSYTRRLARSMVVEGDSYSLSVDEAATNEVRLRVDEGEDIIITKGRRRPYASYFVDQIQSFINGAKDDRLASEDALTSLRFIEECYMKRQHLSNSWDVPSIPRHSKRESRILIVGASGFLGTRLAERLSLGLGWNVVAGFHTPAKATRLARLPVKLVECNLLERDQVLRALEECDIVVNCAVGRRDTSGDEKTAMEVYTQGTRNLMEAAKTSKVKKFIHISTAAVLGFKHTSKLVSESSTLKSRLSRSRYEKGKITQEKIVREFSKYFPIVILRPTLIYGPYSDSWVTDILERLKQGKVTLVGKGDGLANLVHVDDVVDAIVLAIENDSANNTTLIVNNDEQMVAWADYVSKFAEVTHTSPNILSEGNLTSLRLEKLALLCADSIVACIKNVKSPEALILLSRIPLLSMLGSKLVRGERRKRIEELVRSDEGKPPMDLKAQLAKYETISDTLYDNLTCRTLFSSSLAKRTLKWKPRILLEQGLRTTLEWAEWAGLI